MLRNYIGDRAFYRRVISVALPIIIQNGIANFVSLLDNIMVGQVGQIPMSGVAIVNQLMFVFYLCIFGALSGAGIFSTQYFGKGDLEGVRHTIRFKLIVAGLICTGALLIFLFMVFCGMTGNALRMTMGEDIPGPVREQDTDAERLALIPFFVIVLIIVSGVTMILKNGYLI